MKFLAVLYLLFSLTAFSATQLKAPVEATATTTSTKIIDSNSFRNYLIILNKGSQSVYVKTASIHSGTEGVLIPAGGNWEPYQAPQGSIWIKSAASTSAISVIEGDQ